MCAGPHAGCSQKGGRVVVLAPPACQSATWCQSICRGVSICRCPLTTPTTTATALLTFCPPPLPLHLQVRLSAVVEQSDVEEVQGLVDLILKSDPSAQEVRRPAAARPPPMLLSYRRASVRYTPGYI